MSNTIVVLDTCAIISLRKSFTREFLDASLYEFAGLRKEQRIGDNLRTWLNKANRKGWKVCVPKSAIMESDNEMRKTFVRVAQKVPENRNIVKYRLHNQEYIDKLYTLSANCVRVPSNEFQDLVYTIKTAYNNWKNSQTLDCIKKHGLRQKTYFPEPNDIKLLAQAAVNRKGTGGGEKRVLLITNDAHFLCHVDTIETAFGVEILDYHRF
ncbi:MAG: hypothetical protein ACOC3C_03665 [Candidatus Thorarchaeota archaeon]